MPMVIHRDFINQIGDNKNQFISLDSENISFSGSSEMIKS